ncbi:S1C family serine protease [Catenuloplanes indicus]|uniref:Serine protease PepD n=1 Tax=Catenuloplanes indicus TaxID=137267 RepID=A0AAE4AX78_9ACTN|nr:trypsin-like peptidase domain-containing protein [Catenuloplanes indicus]MDQ0365882.1 putative serine protease PepD [Catenuloplanes indicus]
MTDAMHRPEQQINIPQRYEGNAHSYGSGLAGTPAYAPAALSPLGLPAVPPAPPAPPAPPLYPPMGGGPIGGNGRPRRRRGRLAAAALALALAAGTTGGVIGNALGTDGTPTGTSSATAATVTAASAETITTLSGVVQAVSPSIVTINIQSGRSASLGSGVIISTGGLVLTNNHVVADGGTITVDLADGRTVPATLVGTDASHDLAVIQLADAAGLTAAVLGDSDSLTAGQTVLAFGSPLGLEGTVTSGIVSALHRETSEDTGEQEPQSPFGGVQNQQRTTTLSDLIQTDAAINSGNSGGALVDTAGRVIGINVAIATTGDSTGNIGVGFAIPVNTAKTVIAEITGTAV